MEPNAVILNKKCMKPNGAIVKIELELNTTMVKKTVEPNAAMIKKQWNLMQLW